MDQGTYKAKAIDFDFGVAGTGTDQIAVCFELTEEGDTQGEKINWYGYFTEGTAERTIKALRDLGWTGDNLATMGIEDLSEEVSLVIEEDDRGSLKVQWVNKVGSGGVVLKTRMTPDQKNAFAARMRGLCMAKPGATPAPAKAAAPAPKAKPTPRTPQRPAPKSNGQQQPEEDEDMPAWVTE